MSLEDFHLLDNEPIDNSIVKRDFSKIYFQQGAQLNDPDQKIEFIFGENINYHQIGNSRLEFDISVRDLTAGFNANAEIILLKNAFVFCFKEVLIATTGGLDIEHVKPLGQSSNIMRCLASKNGDLLLLFDKINDGDTKASTNNTFLKEMLIDNHSVKKIEEKLQGSYH